jgi:monoamine oxidase
LSALVQSVRRKKGEDGKISVEVDFLKNNQLHTLKAERVILAVPFVRLHQINFDPPLEDKRLSAINTLVLGQYTVVHLIMDKAAAQTWEVNGQSPLPVLSDGPLGVIYGVQHDSPADQDKAVFALLIYGMYARLFHMVPRDVKIKEIVGGLDRLWPGFSRHVKASHVYTYHPGALPVWPPGRSPLDERADLLRQPEMGAYFAGDYLRGSHSDSAVQTGLEAARAIAKELGE